MSLDKKENEPKLKLKDLTAKIFKSAMSVKTGKTAASRALKSYSVEKDYVTGPRGLQMLLSGCGQWSLLYTKRKEKNKTVSDGSTNLRAAAVL